jgi:hypothetical protein
VPVAGCTTAGEMGPEGYVEGAIVGLSLAAPEFAVALCLLPELRTASVAAMQARVREARLAISDAAPWARHQNLFAITLIDGVCRREEAVIGAAHAALGGIPIRGGSAGDGLRFRRTFLLHEGRVHGNAALVAVIATTRRFVAFKTEHFVPGAEKVVVTGADPERRVVTEINAEPAAEEYARLTGVAVQALSPAVFATHPMVVRVGGQSFVRSIRRVNADRSLTFLCAIEEGLILTVGYGVDLVRDLEDTFGGIEAALGPPETVIGFDCILRTLELDQRRMRQAAGSVLARHNVIGFCTYGEQYEAMHVNQTFSGVAIGAARA